MGLLYFTKELNSTRIGTILQALLYVSGLPYLSENYSIYKGIPGTSLVDHALEGPHPHDANNTYCYGKHGCITLKYSAERGFHLFPMDITSMRPKICLHTRESKIQKVSSPATRGFCGNIVNRENMAALTVSATGRSLWIAHGYLESGRTGWVERLVDELLKLEETQNDLNIFVVDWSGGAAPPYTQAVANLPLLAVYVGDVMLMLQEAHGLKVNETYFVGHSLGAHLAGLTGAWLKERGFLLDRITALDPAQPYFQKYPVDARLDPSDALKVDVIHTDAKPMLSSSITGFGMEDAVGTVDFYPNSGRDQPGCTAPLYQAVLAEKGSLLRGLKRMVVCDHMRSTEYFIESVNGRCPFTGFACPSWPSFLSGECEMDCKRSETSCIQMGYHSWSNRSAEAWIGGQDDGTEERDTVDNNLSEDRSVNVTTRQNYYLITGSSGPFCRDHYMITVGIGRFSQFFAKVKFNLVVRQGRAFPKAVALDERDLRTNFTQKYLVADTRLVTERTTEIEMEVVPALSVRWFLGRKAADFKLKYVEIALLDKGSFRRFCPSQTEKSTKEIKLSTSNC